MPLAGQNRQRKKRQQGTPRTTLSCRNTQSRHQLQKNNPPSTRTQWVGPRPLRTSCRRDTLHTFLSLPCNRSMSRSPRRTQQHMYTQRAERRLRHRTGRLHKVCTTHSRPRIHSRHQKLQSSQLNRHMLTAGRRHPRMSFQTYRLRTTPPWSHSSQLHQEANSSPLHKCMTRAGHHGQGTKSLRCK